MNNSGQLNIQRSAYSYQIGTTGSGGSMQITTPGSITNPAQFTFTDSSSNDITADFTSVSLTTDGVSVYLNFTAAVPEPTALLGLAALALLALRRQM